MDLTVFLTPTPLRRTTPPHRLRTTTDQPPPARTFYTFQYAPPLHRLHSVITSSTCIPIITSPATVVENSNSLLNPVDSNHEFQLSANNGTISSDNIDSWKRRLTTLLYSKDKQELVSRKKQDRRDYEQIAALASKLGLYSRLYVKVVIVSKVPLPNYRFDLDDKRPQREVILPPGLYMRVYAHLGNYLSQKTKSIDSPPDKLLPIAVINGSIATKEGPPKSKDSLDKVFWRRSMQMSMEQQAWQKSSEGEKMLEFRRSLPAYKEKDVILNSRDEQP